MSNDLKRRIIKMERSFCFFIIATIMLACNGQKKMAEQNETEANDKLTLIDQNNYSGADSTETMVITNSKALRSFYSRINRTRKPGLPVPEIDFSRSMVVIFCSADEVVKQEYKLSILEETDDEMVFESLEVVKNEQNTSSSSPEKLVSPFFVYKMPLTEKKVSFKNIK